MRTFRRIIAPCTAAILIVAAPAAAQSERDLRRENERLRAEVEDLKRELEAARRHIAELEHRITQLTKGKETAPAAPAGGPSPEPEVTIDESLPHASPRALLSALKRSYQEMAASPDVGDPRGDEQARSAYRRAVNRWVRGVNRDFRGPVEWHVTPEPPSRQTPGEMKSLLVQAVDPQTAAPLGDPFRVLIRDAVSRRLREYERRGPIDRLRLKGVLVPEVAMRPQRLEPGTFDTPPLIGPMAEFGFHVDALSLTPVEKDE